MPNRYNPDIHKRRSIRLKDYDYSSPGAYFVTICTKNRECLFGHIEGDAMVVNDAGRMMESVWNDLPNHYANISLDAFVVMPNHVHGIIIINDGVRFPVHGGSCKGGTSEGGSTKGGLETRPYSECINKNDVGAGFKPALDIQADDINRAGFKPAPTKNHGLPEIVRGFKTYSAKKINKSSNTPGLPLWQRNYYDHIIRNEKSLEETREYIVSNPLKWDNDDENPEKKKRA